MPQRLSGKKKPTEFPRSAVIFLFIKSIDGDQFNVKNQIPTR